MRQKVFFALLALAVALLLQGCTAVPGMRGGRIVTSGLYTLRSDQTLHGDLIVTSGQITLQEGSRVTGSVFVTSGNIDMAGEIDGDLLMTSGNANLLPSAIIRGNVRHISGNINQMPGAQVEGEWLSGASFATPWTGGISILTSILWYLFQSVLLAALAALAVAIWPQPVNHTLQAIVDEPVLTGGLGLLVMVAVPILSVLLAITVCLIPLTLVGIFVWMAAMVFGWAAIGLGVGRRLFAETARPMQPALIAGLGTLVLSLVVNGIGLIPCVGWIAPLLVAALGLGAVVLTRFGRRPYMPAAGRFEPPAPSGTAAA